MNCLQHIVIIYYRDSTFCYISLQFVFVHLFFVVGLFVLFCFFPSMQLNVLNWNFQLTFPCVGKSWNLRSVLLVLVELFGVCPAYEYFTSQPEIWIEFLHQIWNYQSSGSLLSGTSPHFLVAVVALKSLLFIKIVKLQFSISMVMEGTCL